MEEQSPTTRQQQIGAAYIPAHIMCDESLTITQKVLWGRIQGLSTKAGYCYASNEWIGNQIGLKKGTVSNLISQLVDGGYLKRKVIRNEDGEIKERWLYPLTKEHGGVSTQELIGVSTQNDVGINEKIDRGIHAEVEGSVRDVSVRVESKKKPPSDKPRIPKKDLDRLTNHFADKRGVTPKGNAWLPIQQGMKAMVIEEGYTVEQVIGCMDRLALLGWTWTINTVRKWIADFTAGKMPEINGAIGNGNGRRVVTRPGEYDDVFEEA